MLPTWIALLLEAFELGFLVGQAGYRRRQNERVRERLVWGRRPATALPIIDERLRKATSVATRAQGRVADGIVGMARWVTHTRAFELSVLKATCERWPFGKRLASKVHLT